MNPLQRHAILQSRKLAEPLPTPNLSRRNISTATLLDLVHSCNGHVEQTGIGRPITPPIPQSLSELQADVAILVGGGHDPLAEYEEARKLCEANGKSYANFVCNDMIQCFPGTIHHGCTLHPDKYHYWRVMRERAGYTPPIRLWAHRSYPGFHNWTKDWQGSSGLFMVKVARELGYTHIILCGIPMTIEGEHFARGQRWNAAPAFQRGWDHVRGKLRPFVRSMSGWTRDTFGVADAEWLRSEIPDPSPMRGFHDHTGVTA